LKIEFLFLFLFFKKKGMTGRSGSATPGQKKKKKKWQDWFCPWGGSKPIFIYLFILSSRITLVFG
jgi:hypothetical protein